MLRGLFKYYLFDIIYKNNSQNKRDLRNMIVLQ